MACPHHSPLLPPVPSLHPEGPCEACLAPPSPTADRLLRLLLVCIAALTLGGVAVAVALGAGIRKPQSLLRLFNLDAEGSLPAWFSSCALMFCALLLWRVARSQAAGRFRWRWRLLAVLFVGLSADEAVSVHELLTWPLQEGLQLRGLLYYAWVLPALPALGGLAVLYWPLVRALPGRVRRIALWAAVTYVGGAVGMEMLSGLFAETGGLLDSGHLLCTLVEEVLEMVGIALWSYALTLYLELHQQAGGEGRARPGAPLSAASP